MLNSVFFVLSQLVCPEARQLVRLDTDRVVWLLVRDSRERDGGHGESRSIVESQHRPGRRGGSFLNVPEDVELLFHVSLCAPLYNGGGSETYP